MARITDGLGTSVIINNKPCDIINLELKQSCHKNKQIRGMFNLYFNIQEFSSFLNEYVKIRVIFIDESEIIFMAKINKISKIKINEKDALIYKVYFKSIDRPIYKFK